MIQIIDNFQTIDWGGGQSTELFIFPKDSEYKKRNFIFRLSTASVELHETVFSSLENVHRKLMILEGEMSLQHEGNHISNLKKFDVDEFDGGWITKSKGQCVDFNLMLMNQTKGSLKGLTLNSGEELEGEFFGNHFFVWSYKGEAEVLIDNQSHQLKQKSLLNVFKANCGRIVIKAKSLSELVIVEII